MTPATDPDRATGWQKSLAEAVGDPAELIALLELPPSFIEPARRAAKLFPLRVPRDYVARMRKGDPSDPLLMQVLPLGGEFDSPADFSADPLHEAQFRAAPGLLHKYAGRALLIATGTCAVNCRYCFRRHYPYGDEPRSLEQWEPALHALQADGSIHEVILSGGDPLVLSDRKLKQLIDGIAAMDHVHTLRIHTRLPIVLPDRVTPGLIEVLTATRLAPVVVVHANHPHELQGACRDALLALASAPLLLFNQSVLLAGVNDHADTLTELSRMLIDLRVIPYYLHQLDRVTGTAHFEVPESTGRQIVAALQRRLPGYAVPGYVRETPGEEFKTPM